MKPLVAALLKKWDFSYMDKSLCLQVTTKDGVPVSMVNTQFDELPPTDILELLPEPALQILLHSKFMLTYQNGGAGDEYDARTGTATLKKTNDLLHEIGHALWYALISPNESFQKGAAIAALLADGSKRIRLPDHALPTLHREYAALVGAHSGQLLLNSYPSARKNDLEELFARNFDYLIKGKPLTALPSSASSMDDMLDFYGHHDVIDKNFTRFYRTSINRYYGGEGVRKLPVAKMADGDPMKSSLFQRISEVKALAEQEKQCPSAYQKK